MSDLQNLMFLCERVMAELCSNFDDMFGGDWDYDMEPDEYNPSSLELTHNGQRVGARITAEAIGSLAAQGISEVDIHKMYLQSWGKLIPEHHPNLRRG